MTTTLPRRLICAAIVLATCASIPMHAAPPAPPMVRENLAAGAVAEAHSAETGRGNVVAHGIDGDTSTRWCASDSSFPQWYRVDLGKPRALTGVSIDWESGANRYMYKVLGSADGGDWRVLSDQSAGLGGGTHNLEFKADGVRFVRVDISGSSAGGWASFFELRVLGDKLVPDPAGDKVDRNRAALRALVKAPAGFEVTIFGAPPAVNYPACLTAAPDGTLFVGVDEQGSLGKKPGGGRVLRLIDADRDGFAESVNVFCTVDHPRGLIYDAAARKLWVLHPPHLTLYTDTDGDGAADKEQRLVSDISTEQNAKRGADHTTNGIRMGVDGWIYIAVGDFGFANAKGTDGSSATLLGGGVARVRPDGSELEVYARGLRNIYDVAIDPYLNIFTRDNTNDGGAWNLRFSHVVQSAHYGYPSLFMNYTGEIVPALADHGGGSGCGAMYLHAPGRWPAPYDDCVLTCDWGTNKIYVHTPQPAGASFTEKQADFIAIPRPTDVDADATGQLFVASWHNGAFDFKGPDVGFVARIVPSGWSYKPTADVTKLDTAALVEQIRSASAVEREAAQFEVLRRDAGAMRGPLTQLAADPAVPLYARVAAIFTLKQIDGPASTAALVKLAADGAVREWALRALADRTTQSAGVPVEPFVDALSDANPRVRAAAAVGLGRLGRAEVASKLIPLTDPPAIGPHNQANPDIVVPHVAVQALVALNAAEACVEAVGSAHTAGALWALRQMHTDAAVDGLIAKLKAAQDTTLRARIADTLARLYHREADYDGKWWWGTRPDRTGPYYKPITWSASDRIATAIKDAAASADAATLAAITQSLAKHRVKIEGLATVAVAPAPAKPDAPKIDVAKLAEQGAAAKQGVGTMAFEDLLVAIGNTKGDAKLGEQLFERQGCVACHTTKDGQPLKGPHLSRIGSQYARPELAASVLRPGDTIAQGFATVHVTKRDGGATVGFVTSEAGDQIEMRDIAGTVTTIKTADIAARTELPISMMPPGLAAGLSVQEFASMLAFLESLK